MMRTSLALLAALALAHAAAAAAAQLGVVSALTGRASVTHAGESSSSALSFKDSVSAGDKITNGTSSTLRILLDSKAVLTSHDEATLTLAGAPGAALIALENGKIQLNVNNSRLNSGETFEVRTPNAMARITGTTLVVDVRNELVGNASIRAVSQWCALRGSLTVSSRAEGSSVLLGPGQCVRVEGNAMTPVWPSKPFPKSLPDEFIGLPIDHPVTSRPA
jgi:hypothetical protein